MSERQTFTAEEFETARQQIAEAAKHSDGEWEAVLAALRIAANVMRPGVIDLALAKWEGLDAIDDVSRTGADAIRKALLGD